MVQDARKFLVSSDYPMDSVVWSTSGDIFSLAHNYTDVVISHGLPFIPLIIGQFSTDNGTTWIPFTPTSAMFGFYLDAVADATNVTVTLSTSDANISAKYRMWAFAPSNASGQITPPEPTSNYILNSDYNYSKLVSAGIWNVVAGEEKVLYKHNLGYIPEVMVWGENSDGTIAQRLQTISSNTSYERSLYTRIDDTNLYGYASTGTLSTSGIGNTIKIHYRIYGDQNG